MTMSNQFNILVSSAGRRVGLLRLFRSALADLHLGGEIVACDVSPLAAAWHEADIRCLVPRCDAPDYVERLTEVCLQHDVRLLVPTIDTELPVLAAHRDHFERLGTRVLVSSEACITIAADKVLTHKWLLEHGFPTVRQTTIDEALAAREQWPMPLVAKPRRGSSSVGLVRATDWSALEPLRGRTDYIVETMASGHEHTVDILIDGKGGVVCAVPRRRIEVRGGEVSKGVTVRNPAIESMARRLAERLPGAFGVINVQLFHGSDDFIAVLEINARFGGGFPLSARAGANYPRWILEELAGCPSTARSHDWESGLTMLRYDAEVFVHDVGVAVR